MYFSLWEVHTEKFFDLVPSTYFQTQPRATGFWGQSGIMRAAVGISSAAANLFSCQLTNFVAFKAKVKLIFSVSVADFFSWNNHSHYYNDIYIIQRTTGIYDMSQIRPP